MPDVIHPKRVGALLAALFILALLPAAARAACPSAATAQTFQQFGDEDYYSLIPNGNLESGSAGWSLNGASVVAGNESYKIGGAVDSSSLSIARTGIAVSPPFCIDETYPTFRFFADTTRAPWTSLSVRLRYTNSSRRTVETKLASLSDYQFGSWAPTVKLPLSTKLPLWQRGNTLTVRLVFDPVSFGSPWSIDDVYVDPYRR